MDSCRLLFLWINPFCPNTDRSWGMQWKVEGLHYNLLALLKWYLVIYVNWNGPCGLLFKLGHKGLKTGIMRMKLMRTKHFPNCCVLSMNRLGVLPRGFGAFPVLEVLDLTYNNLDESNLPGNFFMMGNAVFLFLMLYVWKRKHVGPVCFLFECSCYELYKTWEVCVCSLVRF